MEEKIILRPWAKINLYLKVLRLRNDGYHEIVTLIHPIALFDELIIRPTQDGFVLNCRLDSLPINQDIPNEEDNLVAKAVRLFFNRINRPPSVRIELLKRIPIGGGLGGGSSDAAGTLIGLNKLFGHPLSREILYKICLELGMDVPFFMEPKPALCIGRGEVIARRYNNINFWCVLVNPGKSLSTKGVYDNLTLTDNKTIDNISHFAETKDIDSFAENVYNDLETPAISLEPEIGHIIELVKRAGVIKTFVCGSGSTVCGLVKTKEDAEEVMGRICVSGSRDWWIRAVSSL